MARRTSSQQQLDKILGTIQGRSYVVTGVTILLVLAIFIVGIFPAISSIFYQVDQNNRRREALSEIETKRTALRSLIGEEKEKRAVSLALEYALPEVQAQAEVLDEVDEVMTSTNVDLMSISFRRAEVVDQTAEAFLFYPFLDSSVLQIAVRGSRVDLENALEKLEESRRIYSIRDVVLSATTSQGNTFQMNLTVDVYYWNLNKV